MVNEYENEGFDVHVIDSWEKLRELSQTRPKGLYLIPYTRLRMHPEFVPVTIKRLVQTKEGRKYTDSCLNCTYPVKSISRGCKEHCPRCGDTLFTYIPENKRPPMSYRRWIGDIERNGTSIE